MSSTRGGLVRLSSRPYRHPGRANAAPLGYDGADRRALGDADAGARHSVAGQRDGDTTGYPHDRADSQRDFGSS